MRILHVINGARVGGAERVLVNLMREHGRSGHEVHLAVLLEPDSMSADYENASASVTYFCVPMGPSALARAVPQLLRLTRRIRPDVVHSHLSQADLVNLLTPHQRRRVSTLHSSLLLATNTNSQMANGLLRRLHHRFDAVVACGSAPWDYLDEHLSRSRKYRIDNGVALGTLVEPAARPSRFLVVASNRPEKRIDLAVRAFIEISERLPAYWSMSLVGPGVPDSPNLQRILMSAPPDVRARLTLEGETHDVQAVMRLARWLVIPSDIEGLPMVGLEAISQGLPLIATRVGSNASLVADARYLTAAGDVSALANAMITASRLSDKEYVDVSRRSFNAAKAFDGSRMSAQYLDVYRELLDASKMDA